MKRLAFVFMVLLVVGCGGGGGDDSESAIQNESVEKDRGSEGYDLSDELNGGPYDKLFGSWAFTFYIGSNSYTKIYHLGIIEDTAILGIDEYEDVVLAATFDDDFQYGLIDTSISYDNTYIFSFVDVNKVSGCYFKRFSDGSLSICYPMTGVKFFTYNKKVANFVEDEKDIPQIDPSDDIDNSIRDNVEYLMDLFYNE